MFLDCPEADEISVSRGATVIGVFGRATCLPAQLRSSRPYRGDRLALSAKLEQQGGEPR
jgi:hypothetical protein